MCGIIGIVGAQQQLGASLLKGIKRLEYRGYDSVGMAVEDEENIIVRKDIGQVDEVDEKLDFAELDGELGMAHTRWATTGGVTQQNAHPHQGCDDSITLVHNGIIENYEELREALVDKGHTIKSQTDSEVIAHYFEEKLKDKTMRQAAQDFIREAKGTFAIVMMKKGDKRLYALRRGSPLVMGLGTEKNILASDIYAFSHMTQKCIFFEDDEYAEVEGSSFSFYKEGKKITKEVQEIEWQQEDVSLEQYDHYMLKEIMEEPQAVRRLLLSLAAEQKDKFAEFVDLIRKARKVTFVAAGTSYHASLLGVYFLHHVGIEAQTIIASEFEHFVGVDEDTLVIAISQSGETMDVIEALNYAKKHGATIASLVNVPYSTIQRMSSVSLHIAAGQEISVAATKSFVNQVTLMLATAKEFGFNINLETLPDRIRSVLQKADLIQGIAQDISRHDDIYILGRGLSYPVAREIALKIKEISYIHAEGMMGGELKHGTIALIEQGTPVISLISNKDYNMMSNTKEVEARGARSIKITNEFEGDIQIETSNDGKFCILAAIVGQLLAYYTALDRDLPIDKPRNLAKSVTVK